MHRLPRIPARLAETAEGRGGHRPRGAAHGRSGQNASEPQRRSADTDCGSKFYRDMLLIRRFEEKAGQLYGMGLIGGFCHLYIGQEAVVVGMQAALQRGRPGHHRLSRSRPHAGRGMDPKGVMAELTGRATGYSKGKGGSMHMFSQREEFLRRPRHRRRAGAARHRPGLRQQVPRERQGRVHLFRRRRGQPGPGLRELQHGGALEAAGRLRHREQPVRHGHQRRALQRRDPFYKRGALVQHSRRAGRRHGCRGGACRRRTRPLQWCARRQGPDHPGDEDLSLSRPFDVRSRRNTARREEVQAVREKRDPIEHFGAAADRRAASRPRTSSRRWTRRSARSSNAAAEFAHRKPRAGAATNSTPTCMACTDVDRDPDARAVAHDGGGQARQVAGEGRRHGQVRRHPRRDRDRQGDDGVRGGRRRHASARSWSPKAPKG